MKKPAYRIILGWNNRLAGKKINPIIFHHMFSSEQKMNSSQELVGKP